MFNGFFKKNVSLRILVCLLLLIPAAVAIIYGSLVDENAITKGNLESVSILSPDGSKDITVTDPETLSLYSSLTDSANSDKVESSFKDVSGEEFYTISFKESGNNEDIVYKLYPCDDLKQYVLVIQNGDYYVLKENVAKTLSLRDEFKVKASVSDVIPAASVTSFGKTTSLSPNSYKCKYTQADGSSAELNAAQTNADNKRLSFDLSEEGNLKFSFSKEPASVNLIIDGNGTEYFNDKIENLTYEKATQIRFNHDEYLTATVEANWYEEGAFECTTVYTFDLLFDVLPTYRVVDTGALPIGDFTVLRMSDFNNDEMLTIRYDIGDNKGETKVNVYDLENSSVKVALIPYGIGLTAGTHELTLVTESGDEQTVKITAKDPTTEFKTQSVIIKDSNELFEYFTKDAISEFDSIIKKLSLESSTTKLYNGVFEYPTGAPQTVSGGATYGMTRKITRNPYIDEPFVSDGDYLACMDNQKINAANSGKVVYADKTTLYGNTVIIDHGFGVLTTYGNLSSITVKKGDSVEKKQQIGVAGSTGFACKSDGVSGQKATMCFYAVSMNGTFISPKSANNGIHFGN